MQKLLQFLIAKRHWFVFVICEVIALTLLFQHNSYQRNVMVSSASSLVGHISAISSSATDYLHLREDNRLLFERNSQLEFEILALQRKIEQMESAATSYDSMRIDTVEVPYRYITAYVVNKRLAGTMNYITVDKGRRDGVEEDMGVISANGIVGVVSTVGDRFSVVLPLLNAKSKLSCRLFNTGFDGSLVWDGRSPKYSRLEELGRHATFKEGDTIVTSGYSAIFPQGILVGTVAAPDTADDRRSFSLKVKLATDFEQLKFVRIVKYDYRQERLEIEEEARKND